MFPQNFSVNAVDDINNTVPINVTENVIAITEEMQSTYISRNQSGVLDLNLQSNKSNFAVPLVIYNFVTGPYTDIINTQFEYFVDSVILEEIATTNPPINLVETFYDNDWIEGFTNTGPGNGIAYLVPSATKFKRGDIIKVSQFEGALIPGYDGTWVVQNIVTAKKVINGIVYDSIGTDAPYLGSTPVNGGIITWIGSTGYAG
jgi:hypothetical protein